MVKKKPKNKKHMPSSDLEARLNIRVWNMGVSERMKALWV